MAFQEERGGGVLEKGDKGGGGTLGLAGEGKEGVKEENMREKGERGGSKYTESKRSEREFEKVDE